MADIKHNEHYEDVRDNYADNVAKASANQRSAYIPRLTEILRKSEHQITVLDQNELLRVAFYFEDLAEHDKKQVNFFEIPEWLTANLKRNPQVFGKFFRLRSNLKLPQKEATEKTPRILAVVSESDTEKEKEEANKKAEKLWDPANKEMKQLSESFQIPDENKSEDDPTEERLKSPYLMETSIAETVEQVNNQHREEFKLQLQKIVESLLGINMYNRDSLMAQLAEKKMYQQVLAGLFQELGIEAVYTSIEHGVSEKRIAFNIDHNYTFAEMRMGLPQAKVKIAELVQNGRELIDLEKKTKALESRTIQQTTNASTQTQTIIKLQDEVLALKAIPKIQDGKLHYLYVCWDEMENNKNVRYYLATTNKETNSEGFYITKSFIKTTDRKAAIRFATEIQAKKQLQRIDKNYVKHINRDAKISLKEHIYKAYFVELVETAIKDVFIPANNDA